MGKIGKRILKILKLKELDQTSLAKATGIPPSTINSWIKTTREPGAIKLPIIADFLDMDLYELITGQKRIAEGRSFASFVKYDYESNGNEAMVVLSNGSKIHEKRTCFETLISKKVFERIGKLSEKELEILYRLIINTFGE